MLFSALCLRDLWRKNNSIYFKEWFGTGNKYHGRQRLYLPLRFPALYLQGTDRMLSRIWQHTVIPTKQSNQDWIKKSEHIKIYRVPITSVFPSFYLKWKSNVKTNGAHGWNKKIRSIENSLFTRNFNGFKPDFPSKSGQNSKISQKKTVSLPPKFSFQKKSWK